MFSILLAVGMCGIATASVISLIRQVQTGVIRSKYGHRTYRSQEPMKFWFSIVLLMVIIACFYYFALQLLLMTL